jgi:hypothetical protein
MPAWPEIERLLGEIRLALDQMTLDEDALILEATVEITQRIEHELKALVAEARAGALSRRTSSRGSTLCGSKWTGARCCIEAGKGG